MIARKILIMIQKFLRLSSSVRISGIKWMDIEPALVGSERRSKMAYGKTKKHFIDR